MSELKHILEAEGGLNQVAVERAISEIRAGRPVVIKAGRSQILVVGVEALNDKLAEVLSGLARRTARLLLPAPRLRRLGLDRKIGRAHV